MIKQILSFGRARLRNGVTLGLMAWLTLGACDVSGPTAPTQPPTPPPPPAPTLQSVSVTGPSTLEEGAQGQLTVMAQYSDGESKDVTSEATYTSSDDAVATVNSSGLVTAVREGRATITAAYENGSARSEGQQEISVEPDIPEFSLSVSVSRIRILGDCDPGPFIQTGPGEFTYRVSTNFPLEGTETLAESTTRVSRDSGESISINRSRTEDFAGESGSLLVTYELTEWDDNSADDSMNHRRGSRSHRLSGAVWSDQGSNSVTIGSGNCSARLEYSFTARRVD